MDFNNKNFLRTMMNEGLGGSQASSQVAFAMLISKRDQKVIDNSYLLTCQEEAYKPRIRRVSQSLNPESPQKYTDKIKHRYSNSFGSTHRRSTCRSLLKQSKSDNNIINRDLYAHNPTKKLKTRNSEIEKQMHSYQIMNQKISYQNYKSFRSSVYNNDIKGLIGTQSPALEESQVQLNLDSVSENNSENMNEDENISSADGERWGQNGRKFNNAIKCFPKSPKSPESKNEKVFGQPQSLTPPIKTRGHTRNYQTHGVASDFEPMFKVNEENVFEKTLKIHIVTDVGSGSPYQSKKQTNANKVVNSSIINSILSKPKKIEILNQNSKKLEFKTHHRTSSSMQPNLLRKSKYDLKFDVTKITN